MGWDLIFLIKKMQKYLNFFSEKDDILLESSELLLVGADDQETILLIDPKTLGLLETFNVKIALNNEKH